MFYVGWIHYTVNNPSSPSKAFIDGKATKLYYNSRHRGLFYYTIDDVSAESKCFH